MSRQAKDGFLKTAFVAFGFTELYTLLLVAPLVHPRHSDVYHWHGSPLALFLPVFLDLALVGTVIASLLLAARPPGTIRIVIWSALLLAAPAAVSHQFDLMGDRGPSRLTFALASAALIACLLLVLFRRTSLVRSLHRVIGFASALLVFFGFGAALLLAQLTWFAWQARSLNDPLLMHHARAATAPASRPRIIWLILDELSYRQTYERRFPGLQLPAFDNLAAQSTVFTHVLPAGIFTDRVLPSLLSGAPVDLVRSSPSGKLSVHNPVTQQWQAFDQYDTVFQDALDAGYSPAVVGWFIPYCRIAPAVLDRCFWSYNIPGRNGIFPAASLGTNMLQPFALQAEGRWLNSVLARFFPASGQPVRQAALHIADYVSLSHAADQVLADPSADFVLLHMPVPHLGGIYNRATRQLTTGPSGYLDNLALADALLAHLRVVLEQSGQWEKTTFIVMGDHSWRTTQMWKESSTWTTEEQEASQGGRFDDRPAYLVKLPNQHTAAIIDIPFPALNTRALLKAMLQRKIDSPADLSLWVQQNHETQAP